MYLTPEIARIAYQQILAHHVAATSDVMAPRSVTLKKEQIERLFLNTGITVGLLERSGILSIQKEEKELKIVHQVAAGRKVSTTYEPALFTVTVDMTALYNSGQAAIPAPGASTSTQWLRSPKP